MATKIARNVITYGTWRAVYEASTLAEAAGVDPAKLITVIEEADPEGATLLSWQRNRLVGVVQEIRRIDRYVLLRRPHG